MNNSNTLESTAPVAVPPQATGSVVFDGHIYRHPMHKAIYDLCVEIEKMPASEQETKCVVAVGELQNGIAQMRAVAATQAKCLRTYAAECFPADANGQIHFARALMEGVAAELDEAFNPAEKTHEEKVAELSAASAALAAERAEVSRSVDAQVDAILSQNAVVSQPGQNLPPSSTSRENP